jgi:protein involved in polysaccharide export with SLBB domain
MRSFLCSLIALLLAAAAAQAQQRIREGDVLRMAVGGAPREFTQDLELEYTVDDGTINVPMIGRVRAAGLTTSALSGAIEQRLKSEKIFTNPSVVINPMRQQSSVVIGGAVRAPQRVQWSQDMTLSQAVAAGGGPSEWAKDTIRLVRGGKAQIFSRKKIAKEPNTDPAVLPNDYIEVQGDF